MSIQQLCDQSKWPLTEILSSYCNQGNNLDNKDNCLTLRNKNTYIEFSTFQRSTQFIDQLNVHNVRTVVSMTTVFQAWYILEPTKDEKHKKYLNKYLLKWTELVHIYSCDTMCKVAWCTRFY